MIFFKSSGHPEFSDECGLIFANKAGLRRSRKYSTSLYEDKHSSFFSPTASDKEKNDFMTDGTCSQNYKPFSSLLVRGAFKVFVSCKPLKPSLIFSGTDMSLL